jgi:hypothetical protein
VSLQVHFFTERLFLWAGAQFWWTVMAWTIILARLAVKYHYTTSDVTTKLWCKIGVQCKDGTHFNWQPTFIAILGHYTRPELSENRAMVEKIVPSLGLASSFNHHGSWDVMLLRRMPSTKERCCVHWHIFVVINLTL